MGSFAVFLGEGLAEREAIRKYIPLIRPEDKPAIWLNTQTMAKYRPEMKKYYYDPTKYKSYLEQLGIKYPVVRPTSSSQPGK